MPMPTPQQVFEVLRKVEDPDFHRDIVSLGFVQDVEIVGKAVSFRLVLTTPACPMKERFRSECEGAIREAFPETEEVRITMDAKVAAAPRGPLVENLLPQVKNTVAVASGKGGVGKSTVAVNLAAALAATGARVGLLDADIYGPSMGIMLGVTERPRTDEEAEKILPIRRHGLSVMSLGFLLDPDTPVIWRGPMVMKALEQLLRDVSWPELDYMVVDLPPGTGDAQLTITQKVPLSGAVIVTTPNEVALIDARKGLAMFRKVNVPILGIVENMSHFVCPHCGGETEIFSRGGGARLAADSGVPFLGGIPIDPSLRLSGDEGTPAVLAAPDSSVAAAFTRLAEKTAQQMSIRAGAEPPQGPDRPPSA